MKHQHKRVSKVADELITYLFSIGATDIDVHIKEKPEHFEISLKSNYKEGENNKIQRMLEALQTPKQEEIEEYYWELAGASDVGTELPLIGMMIDKTEVNWQQDYLEIVLYRNKQ